MRTEELIRIMTLVLSCTGCKGTDTEPPPPKDPDCEPDSPTVEAASVLLQFKRHNGPGEMDIRQTIHIVNYPKVELVDVNIADHPPEISRAIGKLMFVDEVGCSWGHRGWRLKDLRSGADELCADETLVRKFGDQIVSGDCSVALISGTEGSEVLTAAHCLDRVTAPQDPHKAIGLTHVDFVYTAATAAGLRYEAPWLEYVDEYGVCCVKACDAGLDYAVLQLERQPVATPIALSEQNVTPELKVKPYFHPMGLPMKTLDDWVKVIECTEGQGCTAPFDNGDTGSGGAVLGEDHRLLGIVVGSTEPMKSNGCLSAEERPPNSPGQAFVPVQNVRPYRKCCPECTGNRCEPCEERDCVDDSATCKMLPSCNSPLSDHRLECEMNAL